MEYKLKIVTETKNDLFIFEKTRYAKTIDEIVDYVNEMVKIYKKSTNVVVDIYDECDKKVANFRYDYGWLIY